MLFDEDLDEVLRERLLRLVPGIRDEVCLDRALNKFVQDQDKRNQALISHLPVIPLMSLNILPNILANFESADHDLRTKHLKLLAKTYKQFPIHSPFSFVPNLLKKELEREDKSDDRYFVDLWQIAENIESYGLWQLAWDNLFSSEVNKLLIKGAVLDYLNSQLRNPGK